MTRTCLFLVASATLTALGGCMSSPSPRYYTLDMRPSGRVSAPVRVEVDRLRPCQALDRENILVQISPTEIEYYAIDQWAADLGELVAQKLEAEFAGQGDRARTLVASGAILNFGQVDVAGGPEAHVRLALAFREAGASRYDAPVFQKTYDVRVPAEAAGAAAVVTALSRGLEQIAAAVAHDLDHL